MAHNFIKQSDGSKMCSKCGDEIGVSIERDCPHPVASGNFIILLEYIFYCCHWCNGSGYLFNLILFF